MQDLNTPGPISHRGMADTPIVQLIYCASLGDGEPAGPMTL